MVEASRRGRVPLELPQGRNTQTGQTGVNSDLSNERRWPYQDRRTFRES